MQKYFEIHSKIHQFNLNRLKDVQKGGIDKETIKKTIHNILIKLIAYQILAQTSDLFKKDFFFLFSMKEKPSFFVFQDSMLIEILSSEFKFKYEDIPSIFHESSPKAFNKILFNSHLIQEMQKFLTNDFVFIVDENSYRAKQESDKGIISPQILDILYQKVILLEEKDISQSGSYFSPNSEISYSIFFSLFYLLNNQTPKRTPKERDAIYNLLYQVIYETGANDERIPLMFENRTLEPNIQITFQKIFQMKILDPSCGTGNFLVKLYFFLLKLQKIYSQQINHEIKLNLFGCDVREWGLKICYFRLFCVNLAFNAKAKKIGQNSINSIVTLTPGDFILDFSQNIPESSKFDLIIGNPPYIRHRDIKNPSEFRKLTPVAYRKEIFHKIEEIYRSLNISFNKRIDYSLYFYLLSFQLLNKNGILSFITSNSWMNVRYGYEFHEYLIKYCSIFQITDNSFRSFKHADVNTVISFFAKNSSQSLSNSRVKFVRWKVPYSSISLPEIHEIENSKLNNSELQPLLQEDSTANLISEKFHYSIKNSEKIRIFSIVQKDLLWWMKSSIKNESKQKTTIQSTYTGFNWGNYFFSAPPSFYSVKNLVGSKMQYLEDICVVHRGITTNCNNFFILEKVGEKKYKNGYGDTFPLEQEVLRPFLVTPKQITHPFISSKDLTTFIFYTSWSKSELKEKNFIHALNYIKYAEEKEVLIKKGTKKGTKVQGVQNLASFRNKYKSHPDRWYCLLNEQNHKNGVEEQHKTIKHLYIQKIFNDSYKILISKDNIIVNNTFYEIFRPKNENSTENLSVIFDLLLGSLTFLCLELQGRTNFGGGALDTATFDIGKIMIPRLSEINSRQKRELQKISNKLQIMEIDATSLEFQKEARIELDNLILDIIGNPISRKKLYEDILKIQNNRIIKSESLN